MNIINQLVLKIFFFNTSPIIILYLHFMGTER